MAADLERKSQLARQILRYFVRNPQAIDNLEGIVRWRLLQERIHSTFRETELVLDSLVQEGYLRKEVNPGGDPLYRLNAAQAESARFLATTEDDEETGRDTPGKQTTTSE